MFGLSFTPKRKTLPFAKVAPVKIVLKNMAFETADLNIVTLVKFAFEKSEK